MSILYDKKTVKKMKKRKGSVFTAAPTVSHSLPAPILNYTPATITVTAKQIFLSKDVEPTGLYISRIQPEPVFCVSSSGILPTPAAQMWRLSLPAPTHKYILAIIMVTGKPICL